MSKNISTLSALKVILLFIVFSILTMILVNPELIKYEYSPRELDTKKDEIYSLSSQIAMREGDMRSKMIEIKDKEKELLDIEDIYMIKRNETINMEAEIHLPSLLVRLEEKAKENNLDIIIRHSEMTTSFGNEGANEEEYEMLDPTLTETEDVTEEEGSDEFIIENITDGEIVEEHTSNTATITDEAPSIEGVNVTSIPVEIRGDYFGVRDFIRFLDKMDYISPSFVDIASDGDNISCAILIHVFSGEVR